MRAISTQTASATMKRYLSIVQTSIAVIVGFGWIVSAHGDIRGTTTVKCYNDEAQTPCTDAYWQDGVVLGSKLDGTFFEAFTATAELLNNIKAAVEALVAQNYLLAGYEGYEAYENAIELQDKASDKTSFKKYWVRLDQAAPYTRVTVTFDVISDDDPFRDLLVAAPRVQYTFAPTPSGEASGPAPRIGTSTTFNAIVVEPTQGGKGSTNGRVTVTLYPKRIPQGATYPILFSTIEDDCSICLGIVHEIQVSTFKTCGTFLSPGTYCGIKGGKFDTNVKEIGENYATAYSLMSELTRTETARQRYCGMPQVNPKFDAPRGCGDPAEERYNPGACPEFSAGLSQTTCNRVAPYFRRIQDLRADNEILADTILQNDCCNEYVNPNGGTGIKPANELNQRATEHPLSAESDTVSSGHDQSSNAHQTPTAPTSHPELQSNHHSDNYSTKRLGNPKYEDIKITAIVLSSAAATHPDHSMGAAVKGKWDLKQNKAALFIVAPPESEIAHQTHTMPIVDGGNTFIAVADLARAIAGIPEHDSGLEVTGQVLRTTTTTTDTVKVRFPWLIVQKSGVISNNVRAVQGDDGKLTNYVPIEDVAKASGGVLRQDSDSGAVMIILGSCPDCVLGYAPLEAGSDR